MAESMSNGPDEISRRSFLRKAGTLAAGAGATMMGTQAEARAESPEEETEQFRAFRERFNVMYQDFQNKANELLGKPEENDGLSSQRRTFIGEAISDSGSIKSRIADINAADMKYLSSTPSAAWNRTSALIAPITELYFVSRLAGWNDLANQFDQLRDEIEAIK